MSARAKAAALAEIAELAENAPYRLAPLRERAVTNQISADVMHERMADATAELLRKLDAIHSRRVAPYVWTKDAGEIRDAFAKARAAIMAAALDA